MHEKGRYVKSANVRLQDVSSPPLAPWLQAGSSQSSIAALFHRLHRALWKC